MKLPVVKPSRQSFIVLVVIACLLAVGFGFMYYNRAAKLSKLGEQIAQKQKQLDDSKRIAKRLEETQNRLLDAQTMLRQLESGVSTKAFVPTLLQQLELEGKRNHLNVSGVRPRPVVVTPAPTTSGSESGSSSAAKAKVEPYDKLDIDIQVSGKYWDVERFIRRLTSFPKIVAVHDLQVEPITKGDELKVGQSPVLSVRMSATAFILKEGKPADQKTPSAGNSGGTPTPGESS